MLAGAERCCELQAQRRAGLVDDFLAFHREDGPRDRTKENLDMTTGTSKLIELKLAVIKYHQIDGNDYLIQSIARDACYTSHNSIVYKKKQMADEMADYETKVEEKRDAPLMRISNRIDRMEIELDHLEERHHADLAAYTIITDGLEWSPPPPKKRAPMMKSSKIEALKKRVAA